MPYIDLKLVGKPTKEQKAAIARGCSDTLLRVATRSSVDRLTRRFV